MMLGVELTNVTYPPLLYLVLDTPELMFSRIKPPSLYF
jgi:hypothetical protein